MMLSLFDELAKLGAISDEQAQRSLDRLDSLEKSKPTWSQLGRYTGIGAVAGPAISAIGNAVAGKPILEGTRGIEKFRNVAANAVKGGLSAGAIPIARHALDRRAEIGQLREYLSEHAPQASSPEVKTAGTLFSAFSDELQKVAYTGLLKRTLGGAVIGGALGTAVDKKHRIRGGLIGGALGGLGGVGYHAFRERTPASTMAGFAQALDNRSDDVLARAHGVLSPDATEARQRLVGDISALAERNGLDTFKGKGRARAHRQGSLVNYSLISDQRDVANRLAPIVIHGDARKDDLEKMLNIVLEGTKHEGRTISPEQREQFLAYVAEARKPWYARGPGLKPKEPKLAAAFERNAVGANKFRSPTGGLTAAGREHFARTEGANLKPGVKAKNPKGEDARRKGSFLTRFFTNPRGPLQDEKGRPTRLALSAQAWGEPVPKTREDAARLAEKGRGLLAKSK